MGTLYKLGYKPILTAYGEVILQATRNYPAGLNPALCIPSSDDIKNVRRELQQLMFPKISILAHQTAELFSRLQQSTHPEKIKLLELEIKSTLDSFEQLSAYYANNRFSQFRRASEENYHDMISSVFVENFSERIRQSTDPAAAQHFLKQCNCVEMENIANREARYGTPVVLATTLKSVSADIAQNKQISLASVAKTKPSSLPFQKIDRPEEAQRTTGSFNARVSLFQSRASSPTVGVRPKTKSTRQDDDGWPVWARNPTVKNDPRRASPVGIRPKKHSGTTEDDKYSPPNFRRK